MERKVLSRLSTPLAYECVSMDDFVTYEVPSKAKMRKYRSEVSRQKRKEEENIHYRKLLGTWMVVVCPEEHLSAVPYGTRFHCERCNKDFTVHVLSRQSKITPNTRKYWFEGNWRRTDAYWYQKNWKKAMVFEKGLSEEEARQLVQKLERGETYDNG
jgi:hypothetical protein